MDAGQKVFALYRLDDQITVFENDFRQGIILVTKRLGADATYAQSQGPSVTDQQ